VSLGGDLESDLECMLCFITWFVSAICNLDEQICKAIKLLSFA